jgi:hypothetical protein
MHAVIETSVFLRDAARAGLSETERDEIISMIARDPTVGEVIPGTGGAHTYFAAEDVPVLMLAVVDKGERADLTKAEQNELRAELSGVAEDYRESVRRAVARRRGMT